MEWPYPLENIWIIFLQQVSTWLVGPMQILTMLGNEEFYMLVMPILYWSIDSVLGIRIAVLLLLSNGINNMFKLVFHSPRPYWLSPGVQAFSAETTFGFPSGHAQNAAAIWGYLAVAAKARLVRSLLLLLVFLIGFSRIVLGMHFISDVIGGWLIGSLLVAAFIRFEKPVSAWLARLSFNRVVAVGAASSLLLASLILLSSLAMQNWQIPQEWTANALAATPEEPIAPGSLEDAFTTAGTWLGMWVGVAWLYHYRGGFQADGTPLQRLLRYAIGLVGVFFFWRILGSILPDEADLLSYLLRLCYTLVGLWVSVFAPLIFVRLGLSHMGKEIKPAALTVG